MPMLLLQTRYTTAHRSCSWKSPLSKPSDQLVFFWTGYIGQLFFDELCFTISALTVAQILLPELLQNYFTLAKSKRSDIVAAHYCHWGLSIRKVSTRNSWLGFPSVSEEIHSLSFDNRVRMQYLDYNKLAARNRFQVIHSSLGPSWCTYSRL
jgi:hypothetical protein